MFYTSKYIIKYDIKLLFTHLQQQQPFTAIKQIYLSKVASQLRTGGLCWYKTLLSTCPCKWQL